MKDLADGYAMRYPHDDVWSAKLEAFTTAWKRSCPYFNFEIFSEGNNGSVWLHITGPEGTRSFVEGSHQMLTSHLNPAASSKFLWRWRFARLTNSIRILPDFLIIGAKKCGTTSLYSYLTAHPGVRPALKKEIYFFDGYFRYGLSWYRAYFPTVFQKFYAQEVRRTGLITGEASPEYILDKETPKRVFEIIPRVKLIAILRNPVDKAYSYYQHQLRVGFETASFEEAVEREIAHLEKDPDYFDIKYSYLAGGFYAKQLQNWLHYFPADQLLVLPTEALSSEPGQVLVKTLSFLDLPEFELQQFKKLNAFPYPEMDAGLRKRLVQFFKPHNESLYSLIRQNFGWDA